MKKYLIHVIWIVVAVAAFVGGMYYGKAAAPSVTAGRFGNFAGGARSTAGVATRNGGGFTMGQVVSEGAQSITIALPNGNSEIVFYSSSTEVTMPSAVSMSDVATGTEVTVSGTTNSDGSLTAQSIEVRPSGAPGGGFPTQ